MSLINDALRRASQTEKDRPRTAPTPMAMEPVPVAQGSRLTAVLGVVVLIALLLAGWFFWQWWVVRNKPVNTVGAANVAAPVTQHIVAPPQAQPPPKSPVAAPAVPVKPAPAPVVVAAPVAVPAPPVAAPPVPAPAAPPIVVPDNSGPWPVDLTLTAVFYSKTNPKALINGDLYAVGDEIQGVVVRKIEREQVTVEWNRHSKILMLGGQ
jgi:hypothetical protein